MFSCDLLAFLGNKNALAKTSYVVKKDHPQIQFPDFFMGVILGVKNPKNHAKIIQKDPYKAFEYIAFASLLAKRVDESTRTGTHLLPRL